MDVRVVDHPLAKARLSTMRDARTDSRVQGYRLRIDASGQVVGFDIEIGKALCAKIVEAARARAGTRYSDRGLR